MKKYFVAVFIVLLIAGCFNNGPTEPKTGTVNVTVVDSEGESVEDVKVVLAEYTTHTKYTNSSGECAFQDIPTIMCVIYASKSRLKTISRKISVEEGINDVNLTMHSKNPYLIYPSYSSSEQIIADEKRENLYIIDDYSNSVVILDVNEDTCTGNISLSEEPIRAAISADNDYLFITGEDEYYYDYYVEKIDLMNEAVVLSKQTDYPLFDIEFGNNLLFVSPDYDPDSIIIMDAESLEVEDYITGGYFEGAVMEIDKTENILYTAGWLGAYKCSIDSGFAIDTLMYYDFLAELIFVEENQLLFTLDYDEVVVIDAESFEITHTISANNPESMAYDKENKRLFVLMHDYNGYRVLEFDSSFIEKNSYEITGINYSNFIEYLSLNNKVYGLARDSNGTNCVFVLSLDE
jgi:YVTN family beta-propeller protein